MENRVAGIELGLNTFRQQLTGFEERITQLFATVDPNDQDLKNKLDASMDAIDNRIQGVTKVNKDTAVALNARIQTTEQGMKTKVDATETG